MADGQRQNIRIGVGTTAAGLMPKLRRVSDKIGATSTLLADGYAEFNTENAKEPPGFGRDGVVDVTPDPKQITLGVGFQGRRDLVEAHRDSWEPVLYELVDKLIEILARHGLVDGQTLWMAGIAGGHRFLLEDALRRLKAAREYHTVIGLTVLPQEPMKRLRLREAYDLWVTLRAKKLVATTLVVDNRSPFVAANTLTTQDNTLAWLLGSLMVAQKQFSANPSWPEVFQYLGEEAAHLGMSLATRRVHPEHAVNLFGKVRGTGSVKQMLEVSQAATKEALTSPAARTVEEDIVLDYRVAVVYTVPLPLDQPGAPEAWAQYGNRMRQWLAEQYPAVTPIFTSGNPTAETGVAKDWSLQVSALYPIPDTLTAVKREMGQRRFSRQQEGDESAAPSSNSHQPAGLLHATQPVIVAE